MRLTNTLRETIRINAVKASGLYARRDANKKAFEQWAEKARVKALGGSEVVDEMRKLDLKFKLLKNSVSKKAKKFLEAGDSLFEQRSFTKFNVRGNRKHVDWDTSTPRIAPYDITVDDDALCDEWTYLQNESDDIADTMNRLAAEISGVLSSVTTTEKLVKLWPEAEKFLPAVIPPVKTSTLPTVQVGVITKRIKDLAEGKPLKEVFTME